MRTISRSKIRISPAVERELVEVMGAAEYAVSHPLPDQNRLTLRGYVRSNGRWYVDTLVEGDIEPLTLDGLRLVEIVRKSLLTRLASILTVQVESDCKD